jgi:hypothetical protein
LFRAPYSVLCALYFMRAAGARRCFGVFMCSRAARQVGELSHYAAKKLLTAVKIALFRYFGFHPAIVPT